MPILALQRWNQVCAASGCRADNAIFRRLLRAWASWGRHCHTLSHLEFCLTEFDSVRDLAVQPDEVELALWFTTPSTKLGDPNNEARTRSACTPREASRPRSACV